MKKILILLILTNFASIQFATAQLTAGEIPNGRSTVNPNLHLTNKSKSTIVSGTLDIDCDGKPDITMYLSKGATPVDLPNSVFFRLKNLSFEFCFDNVQNTTPNYYNLGDTLICKGKDTWTSDSIYYMGNYGCFICPGPSSVVGKYIAFRGVTGSKQYGWIKLSFNINDLSSLANPITLDIVELLPVCITGVQEITETLDFKIRPNPSTSGIITLNKDNQTSSITVYDLVGQIIYQTSTSEAQLNINISDKPKGIYFVKVANKDNLTSIKKIVYE